MGAVKSFGKSLLGIGGEDAAKEGAQVQAQSGGEAIASQERALDLVRGDLALGREQLEFAAPLLQGAFGDLQGAIDNPTGGVLNNPFFQALAGQQEERLLASQAARGKVGSGGTGDQLQRNLLLLGNQFAQQNIGNIQGQIGSLQNLAALGSNAAAQTGTSTLQSAGQVGNLLTGIGNAQAAGLVGGANARAQGAQNILQLGMMATGGFSDQRLKENIAFSHTEDGINIYTWDWTDDAKSIVGVQDTQGPIAQELMISRPDLVITDPKTGYLKVLM